MFVARAQSLTYMYVTTCNDIVFERFSLGSQKRIKTVVWRRIDRCVFIDNENALVWTGRQMLPLQLPGIPVYPTLHGQVQLRSPTPGSFLQVEYDKLQWWRPESHG